VCRRRRSSFLVVLAQHAQDGRRGGMLAALLPFGDDEPGGDDQPGGPSGISWQLAPA
jgi:hypothetical protein